MRGLCLLLGLLLVGLVALAGCGRGTEVEPPTAEQSSAPAGGAARATVAALGEGLRQTAAGDAEALVDLAAPGAEPQLAAVGENVRALRVTDVESRYLDRDTPLDGTERQQHGADAWASRFELTYSYAGLDSRPARVEARVILRPVGDEQQIVSFGGGTSTRTPLWLVAPLTVVRRDDTVLAVAGEGAGRYPRLLERARAEVREVLPQWRGPLVVEVPSGGDELEAALAAPAGEYDAIAGLATAVDGSTERGAPLRVYLNPEVFEGLSDRGAQVVLTHETAHIAVDAPSADMPMWLLEGFADYIALAGGQVPVDVAARQVLQRIRDEGLPEGLPTSADLEPTAADLGATYEEAWLACRYLAQVHGDDAMVRFYEVVDSGTPPAEAFEEVLGTSEEQFVRGWRADLAGLAGVAG